MILVIKEHWELTGSGKGEQQKDAILNSWGNDTWCIEKDLNARRKVGWEIEISNNSWCN